MQVFLDDHVRHRREKRHIGAWPLIEPDFGKVHHFDAARVGHDQLGAVLAHGLFHLQCDNRMRFGGVRAGHDKNVALDALRRRVGHGRGANRHLERNHRTGVAEACAMVDVVCVEDGAKEPLSEVIVLVRGFCAEERGQCPRSVLLIHLGELGGDQVERLIPGHGFPRIVAGGQAASGAWAAAARRGANHRRGYAFWTVDEVPAEATLDAQIAMIDDGIVRRGGFQDLIAGDVEFERAANATERTDGGNDFIRKHERLLVDRCRETIIRLRRGDMQGD